MDIYNYTSIIYIIICMIFTYNFNTFYTLHYELEAQIGARPVRVEGLQEVMGGRGDWGPNEPVGH